MSEEFDTYVGAAFSHMRSVRLWMTRADLERIFVHGGGCCSRTQSTYVYKLCHHFKVDVRFRPVPELRDEQGRLLGFESPDDVIIAISAPYLADTVID